jgi:hypothetical protein
MNRMRLLGALTTGLIAATTAIPVRADEPVHYVEIGSIGSPASVSQLVYASAHQKLVLRTGGSAVTVLDLDDGSTQTFYSQTSFTDMSLSPDGRYVFVADYGGENIGYGTPATPSHVARLDLETESWQSKSVNRAVAYHIEAVSSDHFVLTSIDQWITFTYNRWGTGASIDVLTDTGNYFPGYYAAVYYGDIEYDPTSGRLIHGNSNLSSQEITAFKIAGNSFARQEMSGTYGSAQGHGGTSVLATDGSVFYYGDLQVDALDVSHNRRVFAEQIHAANARAAFGRDHYYDPATGALLGSLGFATAVYAPNDAGSDFWAYDPTTEMLRHFFASDEPPPDGPVAYADHARVVVGNTIDVAVLANDFGFASPLAVSIVTAPANGTATVTGSPGDPATIRIRYTPDPGFSGPDSFVYTVSDGTATDSATVTISVDAFRAMSDAYVLPRNASSTALRVAENDVGFGEDVTLTITSQPTHGYAYLGQSSGSASEVSVLYYADYYAPDEYADSFSYQISDGTHTDTATVSLQVFVLKALDDVAITSVGTPVPVDVMQNDIRPYGSYGITLGLFETARHGTVTTVGSVMTYTPDPGFAGEDSFVYAIDDGERVSFGVVRVSVIHDADDDDVADAVDNCTFEPNTDQRDSDGDGFGNVCDADLDGNGVVNFHDLALFRLAFGTDDANADFDGSGVVNFDDLARFRLLFLQSPGPSGAVPVPEPGGSMAAALALAALAACARARQRSRK